jgi:hypothetical protein
MPFCEDAITINSSCITECSLEYHLEKVFARKKQSSPVYQGTDKRGSHWGKSDPGKPIERCCFRWPKISTISGKCFPGQSCKHIKHHRFCDRATILLLQSWSPLLNKNSVANFPEDSFSGGPLRTRCQANLACMQAELAHHDS